MSDLAGKHRQARRAARRKARGGNSVVEFALIATPFFFMLFAIMEIGLIFLTDSILDNAVVEAGRLVRTGQAATSNYTATRFKTELCNRMSIFKGDCASRASVDVRELTQFRNPNPPDPVSGSSFDSSKLTYISGQPGSLMLVRVWYRQPLITPMMSQALSRMGNGEALLIATTSFRNEPFTPVGVMSGGVLKRFVRDRRGISAVEFALIAPMMIGFYFGLAEFCQGYMAQKRMGHSAAAVADLVAQTDVVKTSELDDIMGIGALIMKPFSATDLTVRITSITRNANGVAKVDWSRGSKVTPRSTDATVTVPTDVIVNGESVIMAETTYKYTSPVRYLMKDATTFKTTFYSRPRKVDKVGCSDCPRT